MRVLALAIHLVTYSHTDTSSAVPCPHVASTLGVLGIGAVMVAEVDREVGQVHLAYEYAGIL